MKPISTVQLRRSKSTYIFQAFSEILASHNSSILQVSRKNFNHPLLKWVHLTKQILNDPHGLTEGPVGLGVTQIVKSLRLTGNDHKSWLIQPSYSQVNSKVFSFLRKTSQMWGELHNELSFQFLSLSFCKINVSQEAYYYQNPNILRAQFFKSAEEKSFF